MGERWTFGLEPLAQTVRAAAALRRVTSLLQACEVDDPSVDQLVADLEKAEAALGEVSDPEASPRVGPLAGTDGRVYIDHARDIGVFNPCFPEYEITVDGDDAHGTVHFPIAYEGPPGVVHGGFLALFFDCVVQHHNCDVGVAGKTTAMQLRYRRPTPLLTTLPFSLTRTVDGERIRSVGQLVDGDRVLCEAEVDAIAGNRDALPAVSPRRMAAG